MIRQGSSMRHRDFTRSYNFLRSDATDAFKELSPDFRTDKLFSCREKLRSTMRKTSENKVRELEKQETGSPPDGCISHCCNPESYVDDNSWTAVASSVLKIVICFLAMMLTTFFWAIIMVILLPWPCARIKQGNIYGHFTGRMLSTLVDFIDIGSVMVLEQWMISCCVRHHRGLISDMTKACTFITEAWENIAVIFPTFQMWILGNPITIKGAEYSNLKAIYVSNHASPLDIFLIMWLTPTGTVGIAKKEIIWYPLFGQLYVLANHLRIDRSNPSAAIESMKQAARAVVEKNLSLIIFPEGTRSKSGRLLSFKKGFVHLAIQSRRPIVPIVLTGTHLAWKKNSLHVRPAPLTVTYLPPISTDDWTIDKVDEYVEMLHSLYITHLPDSQKPLQ